MPELIAIKAALAAATNERTWKVIGTVIAGAIMVILLPILLITTLVTGNSEQSLQMAKIAFEYGEIPDDYSVQHTEYILQMQEKFIVIDEMIASANEEIENSSLDDIRIKAVFYTLYFASDLSDMEDEFLNEFVNAFTDGANLLTEAEAVYTNISALIGREISEEEKTNGNAIYNYIKYGYVTNAGSGGMAGIPTEALNDETFAQLMEEATKYIGFPYVWGGSNPSESFDCSGFVCWSYTQSGVYDLPRTTAQGIYNQCSAVAKNDLRPGDLIFFTKTYKSSQPVTHIGIVVGEGKMIHAGDPIGITSYETNYWQSKFYGFGRLPNMP